MTIAVEIRDLPKQTLLLQKTRCNPNTTAPAFARAIQAVVTCVTSGQSRIISMPYGVFLDWRAADCELAASFKVAGNITSRPTKN